MRKLEIGQRVLSFSGYRAGLVGIIRGFQGDHNEFVCVNSEDNMKCDIIPVEDVEPID